MVYAMRFLIFILLCILMSPLLIFGLIYYTLRIRRICVRQNISGTANEPYASRLMMHIAGARQDYAAYKIAGYLPSFDKLSKFLLIEILGQ